MADAEAALSSSPISFAKAAVESYFAHFNHGKVCYEPRRPIRPALISGFCSMKRLGVFLLPPGWDASPSQGYPQH